MSSILFAITRDDADESRDVAVVVDYTYSAYGIDYAASVQLTQAEEDRLYAAIIENEEA